MSEVPHRNCLILTPVFASSENTASNGHVCSDNVQENIWQLDGRLITPHRLLFRGRGERGARGEKEDGGEKGGKERIRERR